MTLTCNIDARGKAVRLRMGIALFSLGLVLLATWALPVGNVASWLVTAGLLAGGGFSIFEARAGWCAVRALGFKTRV